MKISKKAINLLFLTIFGVNSLIGCGNWYESPGMVMEAKERKYGIHIQKSQGDCHETGKLSKGVDYCRIGALTYILNDNGNNISKGFHKIKPIKNGYYAKLSSCKHILNLEGKVIKSFSKRCSNFIKQQN